MSRFGALLSCRANFLSARRLRFLRVDLSPGAGSFLASLWQPLPVCIRCSAIYFGFLFALILKRRPAVLWLKIALVLTLAEVSLEWFVMDSVTARTSPA